MSWLVAKDCAERRFGSAARKQIIMFLADKASDDGSGIWCSKGTIQRHTELGESTVKRTIAEFLQEGILVETGRRKCKNGFTVVYRIIRARVAELESIDEPDFDTGSTVDPVQYEPGTGSMVDGVGGPPRTPNHPKTILKPPTRRREAAAEPDEEVLRILAAYPEDRVRDRVSSQRQIAAVLRGGVSPDELLAAVRAYAAQTQGFTRAKVCFSDNWFKGGRWERSLEQVRAEHGRARAAADEGQAKVLNWVLSRSALCRHITKTQAAGLTAAGLVTPAQLKAAGVAL